MQLQTGYKFNDHTTSLKLIGYFYDRSIYKDQILNLNYTDTIPTIKDNTRQSNVTYTMNITKSKLLTPAAYTVCEDNVQFSFR